jgi:hypothetical protein
VPGEAFPGAWTVLVNAPAELVVTVPTFVLSNIISTLSVAPKLAPEAVMFEDGGPVNGKSLRVAVAADWAL